MNQFVKWKLETKWEKKWIELWKIEHNKNGSADHFFETNVIAWHRKLVFVYSGFRISSRTELWKTSKYMHDLHFNCHSIDTSLFLDVCMRMSVMLLNPLFVFPLHKRKSDEWIKTNIETKLELANRNGSE